MKFSKTIFLGEHKISENGKVFFIAEAGVNHCGDLHCALKLIDLAKRAGADAVKFQSFQAESLVLPTVERAVYQRRAIKAGASQFEMLKSLEFGPEKMRRLKRYCDQRGILILITFFEEQSLEACADMDLAAFKVASTDITNLPFLRRIAKKRKPIILSTGMACLKEVELALREIHPYNRDVILLQCTANYPIKDEDAHLRVMETFRKKFDILVGYSDHSSGVGAAPYAAAFGACVVEKHFTFDKSLAGPDHKASLDPNELAQCIREIRRVEKFLGSPEKKLTLDEKSNRRHLQKCLVAACEIREGDRFSERNVIAKRTGGKGLSPIRCRHVWGRRARRAFRKDEVIVP